MKQILILLITIATVLAGASVVDAETTSNESEAPFIISGVEGIDAIAVTVEDDNIIVEGIDDGNKTFSYGMKIENKVNELYAALTVAIGALFLTLRAWWKNKTKAQKTALVSDVIAAMDDGKVTSDEAVKMIKTHL